MWTGIQVLLIILGVLLALTGSKLSVPILTHAGLICFGWLAMAIGWEAIITRHLVLGQKSRGTAETYSGAAAVMQGIQFNLLGFFLIGVTVMAYLNSGEEVFDRIVRRPGVMLILVGALFLLQAAIAFLGPQEYRQGARWMVTLNLLTSRLLPGLILFGLSLGAIALGALEIVLPEVFDQMGGIFLESLFLP